MQHRPRTFLTFSLFCLMPLLVISSLGFFGNLKLRRARLESDLQHELTRLSAGFNAVLTDRKAELEDLAKDGAISSFVVMASGPPAVESAQPGSISNNLVQQGLDLAAAAKEAVTPLLSHRTGFATIAGFTPGRRTLFIAERQPDADIVLRTQNLLPELEPDSAAWSMSTEEPHCILATQPTLGRVMRCAVPVRDTKEPPGAHGVLVADLKLEALVSSVAKLAELPSSDADTQASTPNAIVMVLDDSGRIVYHTNDALRHQQVNNSPAYLAPVAAAMLAGESGVKFYTSSENQEWLAAYGPLMSSQLSLAVADNYSLATRDVRRLGWLTILLAFLIGAAASMVLSAYYLRRTRSLQRVADGVGEIARGKLDHLIDLRSKDDLRPLADNVGLMTKQLREQIARETETRQFQSFVRLSAALTHDLKNAIEALSLTVANMEHHFENAEFRADAMKTLREASQNLRALVARLSNPVTTLSGEHKRPLPVDLVPMLKRVISMTAQQAGDALETRIELPDSLLALVDEERMEKVVENLVINALEAMAGDGGVLTVTAGETADGNVFFSVSDTGAGISPRFIDERLFHPFATTKKTGVGLGLYTCREVVRANRGAIEVESKQGAGTTFRVVLPSPPIDNSGVQQPNQTHK